MSPTQTNQIDWAALDALLCERLGIQPTAALGIPLPKAPEKEVVNG